MELAFNTGSQPVVAPTWPFGGLLSYRQKSLVNLEGMRMHTLKINVCEHTYKLLMETVEARSWNWDDGLRHLLHLGIYAAMADTEADGAEESVLNRLTHLGADYASMRFRLFEIIEENRVLRLNLNGLKSSQESYELLVQKLREEIEDLKSRGASRSE